MLNRFVLLAGFAAFCVAAPLSGQAIPAGTKLEVRLSTPAGSRISHVGDPIQAIVIAPVSGGTSPISLTGATLSGAVEEVQSLGLGFKRGFAQLKIRFTSIQLPDGAALAINGRVQDVETARESVDSQGEITGIEAAANLSSGVSFLISTAFIHSALAAPAIVVKLLAVRSPDSEIYFPIGTEFVIELVNGLVIGPSDSANGAPRSLSQEDETQAVNLLARLPGQQALLGGKHSSDLVNVLLLGTDGEIHSAFRAAGWTGENRHSVLALYRMYHCLVQRMGYSMAPMSKLTLNGSASSRAYQKSLDTFSKRHHVRLWSQPNSDAWLGAASEDTGFAIRRMHLTHAIDAEIDNERAKIVNDLWFTGCVQSGSLLPRERLTFEGEKGFALATDGDIAVLRMNSCENPRSVVRSGSAAPKSSRIWQALSAAESDIARANPATVAVVAFRSLANLKHRTASVPGTLKTATWRRPSILDQPADKPRREIMAGSIATHGYGRSASAAFLSRKSVAQ